MFKPTFLYIKQHDLTGLLYFGKTVKNPEKYPGSGKRWKSHLAFHGSGVTTIWYCLFLDKDTCTEFALSFSRLNNIVKDPAWANLIEEDGLNGAPIGHASFITNPEETSKKISDASNRNWANPDYRQKMSDSQKLSWTPERKAEYSERMKMQWTPERKKNHSEKMKGHKGSKALKGIPKTEEHNRKNSESLKGKPKSEEHIAKLKIPKNRICRLCDRREMSVGHFTRWCMSIIFTEPPIADDLPG